MVPYGIALQQLDRWVARLELGPDGIVRTGRWKHEGNTVMGKHIMIEDAG